MGSKQTKTVSYPNLAVTTIKLDVEPSKFDQLKDGDKISFRTNSPHGRKVTFMRDIKSEDGNKYEAIFVSKEEAAKKVAKIESRNSTPLFCVHGFNVQPESSLGNFHKTFWKRFEDNGLKYYPIPVIWACNEKGLLGYKLDQGTSAMKTGKGLKAFVDDIDSATFPRKSLLMHSMGNHVVFDGACGSEKAPDADFENIFMVAADIPYDIFSDNPDEGYWFESSKEKFANKKKKADNLFSMLKKGPGGNPVGKIYIVHSRKDRALQGSAWAATWESRIGTVGSGAFKKMLFWENDGDHIREKFRAYIENKDLSSKKQNDDFPKNHSYQFEEYAVKFYFEKALDESSV